MRRQVHRNNKGSAHLDISSGWLDISEINKVIGVRATHYYTPAKCSPPEFFVARETALQGEEYCWQFRTLESARMLPSAGAARVLERLGPKRKQIRDIARKYDATVSFCVMMEGDPTQSPYVWLAVEVVKFIADIGAHIEVATSIYEGGVGGVAPKSCR